MIFDNESGPDFNGFMPASSPQPSVSIEASKTRQSEEVKAAIFMAKQFPRDQQAAFNRIMTACQRKKLAEEAEYEFPKGGSKISGPSIRLAEVLAQCWGNIDYGVNELEQRPGSSLVEAYAWDIETNTRRSMRFTVRHERTAGKTIKKLEDSRDVYEMVANLGARRVRACILGVIPGDIVDAALERCRKTLKEGYDKPLSDRIREALHQFKEKYGVTTDMIEKYLGCAAESFTENDFLRLSGVWRALRDGMAKREDYFTMKTSADFESEAAAQFAEQQKAGAKKKGDGDGNAADK
ncbi:hypothetical protein [Paenibacillus ehimensis]|uniref:Uncharacterized protein n=1 Tax=Paenibacillus ehimensis TaxID=79264 RepID=A0ABT8VLX1_9BACL|nr:hypothetical protein [Paenibacillus ehimensis]MDO3681966.1 hypothetical protein [Paenibacillus ehimensis]